MRSAQHCQLSSTVKSLIGIFLALSTTGCQQQIAGNLIGTWVGRPDTAAARALREAEKYGKRAESGDAQLANAAKDPTDWEEYDLELRFEFADRQHLSMALANGSDPIAATWRVLETSPTGCVIEVETPAQEAEGTTTLRQFEIETDERDGEVVGFLLTESGADRQLGAIYFSRAENQ